MFSFINPIKAVVFGAVLILFVAAAWHYKSLISRIEVLQADKRSLEIATQLQEDFSNEALSAIQDWKNNQKHMIMVLEGADGFSREADKTVHNLERIFSRHDLEKIAKEKPNLLERRVNDASRNVVRVLECASSPDYKNCPY